MYNRPVLYLLSKIIDSQTGKNKLMVARNSYQRLVGKLLNLLKSISIVVYQFTHNPYKPHFNGT